MKSMVLEDTIRKIGKAREEEGDYREADGLLYCGKCHTAREYRLEVVNDIGGDVVPVLCKCRQEIEAGEKAEKDRFAQLERVEKLRKECFTDPAMGKWTFENDNGTCEQLRLAERYADKFRQLEQKNIGLLLWGAVGTGKSFFAGCIANALIDREIPVRMTNFAAIINDLLV